MNDPQLRTIDPVCLSVKDEFAGKRTLFKTRARRSISEPDYGAKPITKQTLADKYEIASSGLLLHDSTSPRLSDEFSQLNSTA